MLIMSLLLMLALAVTFTSLSDKSITSNFKNLTSGFYAAEAGVNNLHRLLRNDKFVMASLPDPPHVSVGHPTLNPEAFITAAEQRFNTTESFPNNAAYKTKIKILDIQVPYPAGDIDPAHARNRVKLINPLYPRLGQVETYSVSYQLESVGEGISGLNGAVTLVEEGVVNFNLLVRAEGGGIRVGSFSEFALFTDTFDPYNPEGPFIYQGLGPGDRFAGRVHTNERFGFWSLADGSDAPTFRGYVTQAYRSASYYRHAGGMPPPPVDADSDVIDGVLVAPKFLAGFDRGVDPIPPTQTRSIKLELCLTAVTRFRAARRLTASSTHRFEPRAILQPRSPIPKTRLRLTRRLQKACMCRPTVSPSRAVVFTLWGPPIRFSFPPTRQAIVRS